MKRKTVFAIAVGFILAGLWTQVRPVSAQTRDHFSFDDIARIIRISDPQISPNGKRIVISVSHIDMNADDKPSQLVLVDVATGDKRPLTPEREVAHTARWSPDGKWIAFVSLQGEGKAAKPQIYILPTDGGEAHAVTSAVNGVGFFAWRPDGKAFAYTMRDDATNKAQIEKHHDFFVVGDQDYLSQAAPLATGIWLQTIDGGKPRRVTPSNWSVTGSLSWSGDGKYLAFAHFPDLYASHGQHVHAAILNIATGTITDLTQGNIYSNTPSFAPDSDQLLYVVGRENLSSFQQNLILTSATQLANRKPIADDIDRSVAGIWTPQHDIFISAPDRTSTGLWRIPAGGTTAKPVDQGGKNLSLVSFAKDGTIAGIQSDAKNPGDLVILGRDATSRRRLTDYNAWLSSYDLGRMQEFTWTNEGFFEDGVLTYPVDYVPGKMYPVVLNIHGGPTEYSTIGFNEFTQTLAARGYFVFEPNYRASVNLGFAYAKAWLADPVAGAGRDIVAGVKALETTGMIDPNRIGVSGWSAGGWMTSWLITHYHIWKAAVSGAAPDDAAQEYALTDEYDYLPELLNGATPWTPGGQAIYAAVSPITFVRNVTTPTLILNDTGDYRVPIVQAYAFYHALKDLGKTVEFIAIPAYGHLPSDPVHQMDLYKVWISWMDRYVK